MQITALADETCHPEQESCPPALFLPKERHSFLQGRASAVLVASKTSLVDCGVGTDGTLGGWAWTQHGQSAKVSIHWTGDGVRTWGAQYRGLRGEGWGREGLRAGDWEGGVRTWGAPCRGLELEAGGQVWGAVSQEACGPASQPRDLLAALEVFPGVFPHLVFCVGTMLDAVLRG